MIMTQPRKMSFRSSMFHSLSLSFVSKESIFCFENARTRHRLGDVIKQLKEETESADEGWSYGILERTGDKGIYPSNYVQKIEQKTKPRKIGKGWLEL